MRAAVCTAYGPPDVLQLRDVEKPVPADDEVLIKVCATTAHRGDVRIRSFDVPRGQRFMARLVLGWTRSSRPTGTSRGTRRGMWSFPWRTRG
jgi:NADPH:quinone reductase-like Zn-dependent oxidoreductase